MAIEKIDLGLCNGCEMCVRVCAVDVIRMEKETKKAVIKYPEDCMLCEMCLRECPTGAVKFGPEKLSPLIVSWG